MSAYITKRGRKISPIRHGLPISDRMMKEVFSSRWDRDCKIYGPNNRVANRPPEMVEESSVIHLPGDRPLHCEICGEPIYWDNMYSEHIFSGKELWVCGHHDDFEVKVWKAAERGKKGE